MIFSTAAVVTDDRLINPTTTAILSEAVNRIATLQPREALLRDIQVTNTIIATRGATVVPGETEFQTVMSSQVTDIETATRTVSDADTPSRQHFRIVMNTRTDTDL